MKAGLRASRSLTHLLVFSDDCAPLHCFSSLSCNMRDSASNEASLKLTNLPPRRLLVAWRRPSNRLSFSVFVYNHGPVTVIIIYYFPSLRPLSPREIKRTLPPWPPRHLLLPRQQTNPPLPHNLYVGCTPPDIQPPSPNPSTPLHSPKSPPFILQNSRPLPPITPDLPTLQLRANFPFPRSR